MAKALPPSKTHGPIVKTGPTQGNNRSRNKDGTWRKKRSDTGKPRGSYIGRRSAEPKPLPVRKPHGPVCSSGFKSGSFTAPVWRSRH